MAVTTARMMGWKTESFREKSFFHYRHLGTAERSILASLFSYGEKDYYLGGHPGLGAIPSGLPGHEAALHHRRPGLGSWAIVGRFFAGRLARSPGNSWPSTAKNRWSSSRPSSSLS